jgi:hypothetical protein
MIKMLIERDLPEGFDVQDDEQAAWHARIAVDSTASFQGRMHWLCTYATADRKLFGVVVVENEQVISDWADKAGVGSEIKFHRVLRVLDPSLAAPPGAPRPPTR